MRRRRTKTPDDDVLLHRARRASADARRLIAPAAGPGPAGAPGAPTGAPPKRVVLATMVELAAVLRELMDERNRLGSELETIDRQSRAVTAYRAASGLRTLPSRAKRS
jgi:hypothetical protein